MSRNLILILGILLIWFLVIRGIGKSKKEEDEKVEDTSTEAPETLPNTGSHGVQTADLVMSRSYTI